MGVARGTGIGIAISLWISATASAAPPETKSAPSTPAAAPAAAQPPAAPAAAAPEAAPAPAAAAAPKPATAKPTGPKLSPAAALKAATQMLASASPSEVKQGLLALAELRGDGAARALANRMHAGLPPPLLGDAIDVCVQLGSPRAIPVLLELMQYKRASVRQRAITALAALNAKSPQALAALTTALDDPSPDVRRASVDALAEVGNPRVLPALMALVQRGQPGALQAVGKLAAAKDLAGLLAHADGGDVTPLKPALQAWLGGEARPLPQQLQLIAAATHVGSPSARTWLVEWLDASKTDGHPRVRQALFDAIKKLDQAGEPTKTAKTTRTIVQGGEQIASADPASPAPAPSPAPATAPVAAAPATTGGAR